MSDLTDNYFYPSVERMWLRFRSLSMPAIDLQKMPILAKKKIISSDDLGGYVSKQSCRIWAQKILGHTLKSRHTENE